MSKYAVWVTLVDTIEAEDRDEAYDYAMDMIETRDGLDISKIEIIEQPE